MTSVVQFRSALPVTGSLISRNLIERRRFVVTLTATAVAVAAMIAALYSSVGSAYDDVIDDLPPAVASMMGDADFSTPEGFIHVELFSFLGPGLAIAAGVSLGASALAGTEQNGQLALITASPIRRSQVVFAAILAAFLAVTAVAIGLFVGIMAGGVVGNLDVSASRVAAGCFSLWLLGVATGSIALAAGALTGRRSVSVGAGAGVAVASYLVDAFFPLSSVLEPFAKVSLWYPYVDSQPIVNGLHWFHVGSLLFVAVLACVVGFAGFERRDLAT